MKWSELEEAYNSCIVGEEKPQAMVASTRWLQSQGCGVKGPGPWLITKGGIMSLEEKDEE